MVLKKYKDRVNKALSVVMAAVLVCSFGVGNAFAAEQNSQDTSPKEEFNIANLRDGEYVVGIEMVKPDQIKKVDTEACGRSMANGAIEHEARIIVEGGKARMQMTFRYLDMMGKRGYLGKFYVHPEAFPGYGPGFQEYTKGFEDVEVLTYALDDEGNKYIDDFNDPDGEIAQEWPKCRVDYAETVQFPLPNYASVGPNGFLSCQVFVPVMESMGGFGTQQVITRVAWDGGWTEAKNRASGNLERLDFDPIKPTQETVERWEAEDAKALQDAKDNAYASLDGIDSSVYRDKEKSQFDAIVAKAKEDIQKVENIDEINPLVVAAQEEISALKTDAQYKVEEAKTLQEAKDKASEAIQKLEAKATDEQGNAIYREAEKAEFDGVIATAKEEVEKAQTPEAVSQALKKAEQAIPSIKTDAEYKAEEAKALQDARDAAKADLDNLVVGALTEDEKNQATAIIEKAKEAIAKAETVEKVQELAKNAENGVKNIETNKKLKDSATSITAEGTFNINTKLVVSKKDASSMADVIEKDYEVLNAFDISLTQKIKENEKVTLTIPVKAELNGEKIKVLHLTDANKVKETLEPVVKNGAVEIQVDSLSPFVLAAKKTEVQDSKLDFANLEDGVYTVFGEMIKAIDKTTPSMSNKAIDHNIKLEVKDGKYFLTMKFKGIKVGNKMGYLGKLKYKDASGALHEVEVLDSIKADGKEYPSTVRYPMIESAKKDGYVPLQVFVQAMEDISDGTGTQPVYLKLDRATVTKGETDVASAIGKSNETINQGKGGLGKGKLGKGGLGVKKPGALGAGKNLPSKAKLARTGDAVLPIAGILVATLCSAALVVASRKRVSKK